LQANFGDHLWWHLEMTSTTDTLLELRDTPPTVLRSDFLILLIELCFQASRGLLPLLLGGQHGTAQGLLGALDLVPLRHEGLLGYALLLFMHAVRLTLLVGRFHKRQKLVFQYFQTLLTGVNFSQDSAIFLIRFDLVGLALRLANRLLMVHQFALEGALLPFTLLNRRLLLDQLLTHRCTGSLIDLQTLRELLLLQSQSAQMVIYLLQREQELQLITHDTYSSPRNVEQSALRYILPTHC
jgi:hypothetical protein